MVSAYPCINNATITAALVAAAQVALRTVCGSCGGPHIKRLAFKSGNSMILLMFTIVFI